jgi:hypothetical protein
VSRRRSIIDLGNAWMALMAGLLAGCAGEPPSPRTLSATEIESPAGADSGEPFLSLAGDTVLMSWLGRSPDGARRLVFARWADESWQEPVVVTERTTLLVNVADFPSVVRDPTGTVWAHWLERDPDGGYGVRVVSSPDGGASWSDPWTPHEDRTPTDHGFVSWVPQDVGVGLVWLDGRAFATSAGGADPAMETALYYRGAGASGASAPETLVDARVCDCCQTDAALTSRGPIVVYRDRSPEEVRDIRVTHLEDGVWGEGRLVHDDGWVTGACPVNGPAVAARGDRVAVAWFTAANAEPRVHAAFSDDAARTFAAPTRVDDGAPAGRPDVVLLDDGTALVSWVERTGGAGTEVRLRRVGRRGEPLETLGVTGPFSERVMGFARLARTPEGTILLAWMDGAEIVPRVRVTRIDVEQR